MASAVLELPSEILADIFLHLASELQETAHPKRWIYASHVCSAWRYAALEDCRLWSTPSFGHDVERTREMLDRARAAPLHIVLDFNRRCNPSCLELAFENLHRARSFKVYGVMAAPLERFIKARYSGTVFQTPLLHSITISSPVASNLAPFFLDITSLRSPGLRSLTLQNWRLSPNIYSSPAFTELTSLEIVMSDRLGSLSSKKESFSKLLGYLRPLQRLQRLHLRNVVRGSNTTELGSPPGAILPDLNELTLYTFPQAWILFLSTVTFPEDATVSVGCFDSRCFSQGLAESCMKRLRDPIRAMHMQECHKQQCYTPESVAERLEFKFWTTPCDEDLGYTEQRPILSMTTPTCLFNVSLETFQYLQHLEHLIYQNPLPIWEWLHGIEHAEHLTLLEVYGTDTSLYELLEPPKNWNFDPPNDPDAEVVQPRMNLPALRDLTLNKWALETDDEDPDFNRFVDILERRHRCGYGLVNLHFWGCGGPNYKQLEKLLGVAENVYFATSM